MICRFLFSLFLISIFTASVFGQSKNKTKHSASVLQNKPDHLSARIKFQKAYEFKFAFGKKKDSVLVYMKKYNEKGNMIEESSPDGKIIYEYNKKAKVILEVSYNSDNTMQYKNIHSYDTLGNMKEKLDYDGNGNLLFNTLSVFNVQNKETKKTIFDSKEQIIAK